MRLLLSTPGANVMRGDASMDEALVRVENLRKYIPVEKGRRSSGGRRLLHHPEGGVQGLWAKPAAARPPSARPSSAPPAHLRPVRIGGEDIHSLTERASVGFCRHAQMIFQNPYSNRTPQDVGEIMGEGIKFHLHPPSGMKKPSALLRMLGLTKNHFSRFPMIQRGSASARIARALS
jgi:hypothetical protein